MKQTVLLRLLGILGWNVFDRNEVHPEYPVDSEVVDYSLKHGNQNRVFIEAKRAREDLEKHQEQLLKYSFQEGVELASLTNGITWWFYLPLRKGSWSERKFYTVEIMDQNPEEIARRFIDFLSKDNVASGKHVENAKRMQTKKLRQREIMNALPRAWDELVDKPDESLVDLVADTTERICGHRPDPGTVEEFLASHVTEPGKSAMSTPAEQLPSMGGSYTGKSIASFTLKGVRYDTKAWKHMLLSVCSIMFSSHRSQFPRVLNLVGRRRPYFSRNPYELRHPQQVDRSGIYVEVNLGANMIVKLSRRIILLFGYSEEDLRIEVE